MVALSHLLMYHWYASLCQRPRHRITGSSSPVTSPIRKLRPDCNLQVKLRTDRDCQRHDTKCGETHIDKPGERMQKRHCTSDKLDIGARQNVEIHGR